MTNPKRPDTAPKGDERPQAEGEKSPFEKMRDLTRRVINVPKSGSPERKPSRRRPEH
jgi:hypothetical protein